MFAQAPGALGDPFGRSRQRQPHVLVRERAVERAGTREDAEIRKPLDARPGILPLGRPQVEAGFRPIDPEPRSFERRPQDVAPPTVELF